VVATGQLGAWVSGAALSRRVVPVVVGARRAQRGSARPA